MLRQAVRGALGLSPHPPGAALPLPLASMLHASFSTDEGERERVISIDRSGLLRAPPHSHDPAAQQHKEPETELVRHLKSLIRFRGGPITLAEYMSEVLTNPVAGYYTQRDVFGAAGDFVTSPEISQMFGEMVGIWCVALWQQLGLPERLRLVELGPGRGTLMADLLRGTTPFKPFSAALEVSLVEISPVLRRKQWEALRCGPGSFCEEDTVEGTSGFGGVQVRWHRSLDEVGADCPTLYIAHEFFDALPVHQFQRTERGWCERLVDVASPDSPLQLRMVLSPGPTPASRLLVQRRLEGMAVKLRNSLQQVEISPQSMATAEALARRVAESGGAALIIDYGQDGPYEASLQAIRKHKFVGMLEEPGSADLSARVDFGALRQAAAAAAVGGGAAVACHGPIPQSQFLLGLGMEARLGQLLEAATEEQAKGLMAGFKRLVGGGLAAKAGGEEGMGRSYKAFCIAPAGLDPPVPFGMPEQEEVVEGGAAPDSEQ